MSDIRAFPLYRGPYDNANTGGMTLRDYFAAKALMGLMASRGPRSLHFNPEDDATYVYAIADAMLKARGES